MLNIAGQPTESLMAEMTGDLLEYIRGVMLQQMSEGKPLRSHPGKEISQTLANIPGVSWSSSRQRYRAVHVGLGGAITTRFLKNLEDAIKFTQGLLKIADQRKRKMSSDINDEDDRNDLDATSDDDDRDAEVQEDDDRDAEVQEHDDRDAEVQEHDDRASDVESHGQSND